MSVRGQEECKRCWTLIEEGSTRCPSCGTFFDIVEYVKERVPLVRKTLLYWSILLPVLIVFGFASVWLLPPGITMKIIFTVILAFCAYIYLKTVRKLIKRDAYDFLKIVIEDREIENGVMHEIDRNVVYNIVNRLVDERAACDAYNPIRDKFQEGYRPLSVTTEEPLPKSERLVDEIYRCDPCAPTKDKFQEGYRPSSVVKEPLHQPEP